MWVCPDSAYEAPTGKGICPRLRNEERDQLVFSGERPLGTHAIHWQAAPKPSPVLLNHPPHSA